MKIIGKHALVLSLVLLAFIVYLVFFLAPAFFPVLCQNQGVKSYLLHQNGLIIFITHYPLLQTTYNKVITGKLQLYFNCNKIITNYL
jgi:hypothetical protein